MRQKLLLALISLIFFLIIMEAASRLIIYFGKGGDEALKSKGWQTEFFKSFLDWHESDPELLWRFKANLNNSLIKTNSDHLLVNEIQENTSDSTFRILLLGDSSPVGLGLPHRNLAFGERVWRELEKNYGGGKEVELINAAVSGYTSEQIKRFLKLKGWQYQPDLVILYCGNNDASVSGHFSDRELLASQQLVSLRKIFSHLAIYRLLTNLLIGEETPAENDLPLKVRVTPEEYYENLNDIADQCREHNCPLIICKPPVPILWPAGLQFKPLMHIAGESGELIFPEEMLRILGRKIEYCIDSTMYNNLYGESDVFTQMVYESAYINPLPPDSALVYYRGLNDSDPVIFNNRGVTLWRIGRNVEALVYLLGARQLYFEPVPDSIDAGFIAAGSPILFNIGMNYLYNTRLSEKINIAAELKKSSLAAAYLDSALQADYFSLRIKRPYLHMIDSVGANEGVHVIDLPGLFARSGGEYLFIDHCHPTIEGHRLIAEELAAGIMQSL